MFETTNRLLKGGFFYDYTIEDKIMINPAIDKLIKLLAKTMAEQWIKENKLTKENENVESVSVR